MKISNHLISYYLQILFFIFIFFNTFVESLLSFRQINILKKTPQVPDKFSQKISLEEHQKSIHYSISKLNFGFFHLLWKTALMLYWFPFKGAEKLYLATSIEGIWKEITFLMIFILLNFLLEIPWSLYSTFKIEEKFNFNKTTLSLFVKDKFKILFLTIIFTVPLLYLLFYLFEMSGTNWWLYSFMALMSFQFFVIWIFPTYISPLFNKFSPFEDHSLKEKISNLLKSQNLNLADIFIMDASKRSSHGNAYFTGLGKNKRIVFYDTLLTDLTHDEILAILAHEIGHLKLKHILKSLLTSTLFSLIGFYLLGLIATKNWFYQGHFFNVSSSGILFLIFAQISSQYLFIFTPIGSWFSRKREFEADAFAANITDAKNLVSGLIKLYKQNSSPVVSDKFYSLFYYSHPPAKERIEKLESLSIKPS